ncbi:hypothetical protein MUK42_17049 [Musa troglodytarum]|uniref:Uncharacterized protein n=1 Tax=Musa troglodytarum TaxID=320322 RepID=A0A9E7KSF4_9LILI|nr:hypothetical protein MUK42_17049 [Musa troglodytarum]
MIVRAKQPSVLRNQNRGEQQRIVDPPPVPPPVLVGNQTASQTPRKRTRKEPAAAATTAAAAQVTATATSNNPGYGHSSAPMLMSSPLQLPPRPPSLSAGFKLFGEANQHQVFNHFSPLPPSSSQDFEDFAAIVKKYEGEVKDFSALRADQFRRTLLEKWRRHCQILLCAAEVEASKDSGKGSGGGAGNATVRAASGAGRAREGRVDSVAGQSPGGPTQHQHPPRRAGAGDGDHAGANGRERRRRRRPRHGRGRPVV